MCFGKHLFQRYGGCRLRLHGIQRTAHAPISSGQSLRNTRLPVSFSSALTTESLRMVPPLYDNMFAQCGGILQAQYLIKGSS